jgi:hypothetical protein
LAQLGTISVVGLSVFNALSASSEQADLAVLAPSAC